MRLIGIDVASASVVVVDVKSSDEDEVIEVVSDLEWKMQRGDRPAAYAVMFKQVRDYVSESCISHVVVKESTVSTSGTKKVHLEAAELRGVVSAAATIGGANVRHIAKAHISRTFGDRDADEYIKSDDFWKKHTSGKLRKGSRMAALLVLSAHKLVTKNADN